MRRNHFQVEMQIKTKSQATAIQSAFLKTDTTLAMLAVEAPAQLVQMGQGTRQLKIQIEVDTNPPLDFAEETRLLLQPIPFSVRTMTLPSLFAGKMHAVLCRAWGQRVKGRDWYDMVWYVGRAIPLQLSHLEARMRQSGHYDSSAPLSREVLLELLNQRIQGLNISMAQHDVQNFVRHPDALALWSHDFFLQVADKIQVE